MFLLLHGKAGVGRLLTALVKFLTLLKQMLMFPKLLFVVPDINISPSPPISHQQPLLPTVLALYLGHLS